MFAESFIKFVQKLSEIYGTPSVSLFSEHGVYLLFIPIFAAVD